MIIIHISPVTSAVASSGQNPTDGTVAPREFARASAVPRGYQMSDYHHLAVLRANAPAHEGLGCGRLRIATERRDQSHRDFSREHV